MIQSNGDDENESVWVDVEELGLRIIAGKIWALSERDLLIERERQGLGARWAGWRQS